MKHIGSIIRQVVANRWFPLVIGLLCVSMLVWFLGPLIVIGKMAPFESGISRLLTIFILIALWSINNLLHVYLDRRRSEKVKSELTGADDAFDNISGQPEVEREISRMAIGFEHAARMLKRASRSSIGDRRYLYQTPWYLTLGTFAAGKTTALRNAGVGFSLIKPRELPAWQEPEDNGLCQWWLCDDAVVIDTVGRHTSHGDNPVGDRLVWQKLLAMLRKYRPQQPINGVILVVNMIDIIEADNGVCATSADAIRQRLQELSSEFKHLIPVYCLVTKCDQVAGFVEYFSVLDRKSKDQVWGITFDLAKETELENPAELFGSKYDQLIERLQTRMIEHLEHETDLERRARIQEFPTQMQLLRKSLDEHLSSIFRPRRFEGRIELRGVYFASATQVDAPVGRLGLFLSSLFGVATRPLPTFSGITSGYFLKSLFADVIFREADLPVYSAAATGRRSFIRHAVAAGALVAVIATSFAWLISYNRNQDYIATVLAQVSDFNERSGVLKQDVKDIRSPLPIFDLLRKMPGGYAEQEQSAPLAARFGLSQRDKLGSATTAAYRRVLQSALLPRLIHRLESQIKASFDKHELLGETLKVYLMLEDPTRFDRKTVDSWYRFDVERWLPGKANAERRAQLRHHLNALFEQQLAPPPPDINLVGAARQILATKPLAQSTYARLREEARIGDAVVVRPWALQQQLGRVAGRVFDPASTPVVPAFYTADAYRKTFPEVSRRIVKEVVDDGWVIGREKQDGQYDTLHDKVVELYLADFADHWDRVINGTRLIPLSSLQQASQVLNDLIGDNAMLRRYFEEISRQTKLLKPVKKSADPTAKIKSAAKLVPRANRTAGRLSRLQAIASGNAATTNHEDRAKSFDQRFARIHKLVEPGDDGKLQIDGLAAELAAFGDKIKAIAKRGYSPQQTNWKDIDVTIALPAISQVEPVHSWVIQIVEQIKSLSGGRTKNRLNAKWKAKGGAVCEKDIVTKYPFKAGSSKDLPLAEFAKFFGSNGLFDKFFKENLEGLIDTSTQPWQAQTNSENVPLVSRDAVRTFERAALIQRLFFQNGSGPEYSFVLVPVSLDQTASKFQLEVGEQRITYRHGPARSGELTWPGSQAIQGARAVFTTFNPGDPTAAMVFRGVWGWFRMMDKFRVRSKANLIQFDVKDFKAIYRFDQSNATDLPALSLFSTFKCPNKF